MRAPRCNVCGRFKELVIEGEKANVYECCDGVSARRNPGYRKMPW